MSLCRLVTTDENISKTRKKERKKNEKIFVVKPLSEKGRRRGNAQKMSEGEGEEVRGA